MSGAGLPLLYAVALWFAGTGLVLWLDRRPRRSFRPSLAAASVAAAGGVAAIVWSAGDPGTLAAYVGFTGALIVWGWHELSFLTGAVTGPNRRPLPAGTRGWRRFRLAAGTLIWHEIALALTAAALLALTWGLPNQTGPLTFLILFVMRLSTKLNIFLGVPNFNDELLPDHLAYLKSYFRKGPVSVPFVVSMSVAAALASALAQAALAAHGAGQPAAGFTLLFGLVVLAVIEHLFLALPLGEAALWRWAIPSRSANQPVPPRRKPALTDAEWGSNHGL